MQKPKSVNVIAVFNQLFYRINIVESKQIGLCIRLKVGAKTISVTRYEDLITGINNWGWRRCTQRAVNEMKGTLETFKIEINTNKKKDRGIDLCLLIFAARILERF